MKGQITMFVFSSLLLAAVSYIQVIQKFTETKCYAASINNDMNSDAEENPENSTEENTRETDQDEDPFRLNDIISLQSISDLAYLKSDSYSLRISGYYPEIVSPPPQN